MLNRTDHLIRLVRDTPLTIPEWRRQRTQYSRGLAAGKLALGFATFYLNRTNHSGIMNGGVIGGQLQKGDWKIDARFNRVELERRITCIADQKRRIHIYCQDALEFLRSRSFGTQALIYLDPPYFRNGKALYMNAYTAPDHQRVSTIIRRGRWRWVVSYDDAPQIRLLYPEVPSRRFTLLHTARVAHVGREVMFFGPRLMIPRVVQCAPHGGRRSRSK